jgi:hypothetical protein
MLCVKAKIVTSNSRPRKFFDIFLAACSKKLHVEGSAQGILAKPTSIGYKTFFERVNRQQEGIVDLTNIRNQRPSVKDRSKVKR